MKQLIAKLKDIDEHWKILTISVTILIVCGALPSYLFSDWDWFSRSGALLVVYGIFIVWRDVQGKIHTALDRVESAVSKKLGEKSGEITNLIQDIQKKNQELYNTIEFLVLAIGTIVWAYGDLINNVYS